ncbi:thioesterase domain-containing protein, partial [Massilia scottii]|uniref:thioesterase domain-containing protein n=1 Tax=Massilia scottii TaxID=3057166 RepID=UPI002796CC4A
LRQKLGIDTPLRRLFANPTLIRFAADIAAGDVVAAHPNLAAIRQGGTRLPLFLIHPGEGEIGYVRDLCPWIDPDIPVYGLAASGLGAGEMPQRTVEEMASRYIDGIRSVQAHGPYRIAGWSAGGTIAYEIARQLLSAGAQVEFVGLIDTTSDYRELGAVRGESGAAIDSVLEFDDIAELQALLPQEANEALRTELAWHARVRDFDAMVAQLSRHGYVYKNVDSVLIRRHLALRHALRGALLGYSAAVAHVPVVLFSATGEGRADPSIGWGALLPPERLRVVPMCGTHYSIMEPSRIGALGAALSQAIAEVEQAWQ